MCASSPRVTKMNPPGSANAFTDGVIDNVKLPRQPRSLGGCGQRLANAIHVSLQRPIRIQPDGGRYFGRALPPHFDLL